MGRPTLAANLLRPGILQGAHLQNSRDDVPALQKTCAQKMTKVTVITGCTCSGKTAAAIEFALKNNAEIVSCDSVQVYRHMDIGSAKASKAELSRVRHHLIDVADVSEIFDVSKYVSCARAALDDIVSRGKNVVVAGGSGFYLMAWFAAVVDNLPIDASIRAESGKIESEGGAEGLAEALLRIDPDAPKFVDMRNPRRTKNALERCMASGKSVAELLDDFSKLPCPMGDLERDLIILEPDSQTLNESILSRSRAMVRGGLIDETRALIDMGMLENPAARSAIGYRETVKWLCSGGSDREALAAEIAKNTIALTKKQRKFFRRILEIHSRRKNGRI